MSNSYDIGQQVICQAVFTLVSTGALVDPTTAVFFQYKNPAGTITTETRPFGGPDGAVARLSEGVYTATVTIPNPPTTGMTGLWYYRWYSTGTGTAADEGVFNVVSSEFD